MLNYSISKDGDIEVVYLEGYLDATTAHILAETLGDCYQAGMHKIIMEMGGISYLSSNGLKPILEWLAATEAMSGRRKLAVCNLCEFTREVFRATEFDLKLPIYENVESALSAFRQNF